jgi:hypothetical protein
MSATLCAIVKNEAPYLVEWVAWHRMIGFDRIVVYDNDSADETPVLLSRMCEIGVLDAHVPWPSTEMSPQLSAYASAARACATDWLMFLDADEFLMLRGGRTVGDFLASFPADVACIGVNWRLFGSSGATEFSPRPVMERFRRAAAAASSINLHVKSLFRPECAEHMHMHAPTLTRGRFVMANGAPLEMETHGIAATVDWSVAQVNHYFCKSRAEYRVKRARGDAHCGVGDPEKHRRYTDALFDHHDLNDELDDSAAPWLPDLGPMCADLRRRLRILQPRPMPGDMVGHEG